MGTTDFHISIRVGEEVGVEGIAHLHKVCEVTTESSKGNPHTSLIGWLDQNTPKPSCKREREREWLVGTITTHHHHHLPKAPRAPTKYSKASCRGEHL